MQWRVGIKLIVLGGIALILLFILSSIGGLTMERRQRQYEVERDIAGSYAGEQKISGPVFTLVYRETWNERLYSASKDGWYDKERSEERTVLVFPESFSYEGGMAVQERYRGIFKANVFQSEGLLSGAVTFPLLEPLAEKEASRVELISASAGFMIADPRGISHVSALSWNNRPLKVEAGSLLSNASSGVHAELPDPESLAGQTFDFSMDLDLYGMGSLTFVPIGSENCIRLNSSWPHPSFIGDFLATDRTVSDDGFAAEWNVNGLACSAQQAMLDGAPSRMQQMGVSLIDPVNPYPLTDRALKYGFLFIFITFSAFFLFEMLEDLRIHPVQYGFVGLAQAVFFLLLLSLSEHVGFGISYGLASLATIGLISFYLCNVMRSARRGLSFGALLSLLYAALFALLQSEDHALIAGSVLLFGLMAGAMLITRKVDWYAIGVKPEGVVR
ncbi:MAG: cell envelope integrity protein CreD [Pontiellaceae bacterium]|nr:cell envelope integrity protein CreD [Pontiellaceae bacterium]MBN2784654.1 cell envelope integrity protein CreD [Pontiellaceae bacterium]